MLQQLQTNSIGTYEHFLNDHSESPVLKMDKVYTEIEVQRKERGKYDIYDESHFTPENRKLLWDACHLHNKALFDAVNESLN